MPLIDWSAELSVNVAEIDKQHQKLIGMINALNGAMRPGKGKDVLGGIIDELIEYTKAHFSMEERYFDEFMYPGAHAHKREHLEFVKKVSEFRSNFQQGKLGLSIEVMDFLSDWLKKHIMGTDKKYGPFFNEKGLN
jgi:hemerythrin